MCRVVGAPLVGGEQQVGVLDLAGDRLDVIERDRQLDVVDDDQPRIVPGVDLDLPAAGPEHVLEPLQEAARGLGEAAVAEAHDELARAVRLDPVVERLGLGRVDPGEHARELRQGAELLLAVLVDLVLGEGLARLLAGGEDELRLEL